MHCQRNAIHINLFVSFVLRSVICLIKDIFHTPEGSTTVINNTATLTTLGSVGKIRFLLIQKTPNFDRKFRGIKNSFTFLNWCLLCFFLIDLSSLGKKPIFISCKLQFYTGCAIKLECIQTPKNENNMFWIIATLSLTKQENKYKFLNQRRIITHGCLEKEEEFFLLPKCVKCKIIRKLF